jgi:hypothetical protein
MTSLIDRNRLTLVVALFLLCAGSAWLMAVRDTTLPSISAMVAAMLTAAAAISINLWKRRQTTVDTAKLAHETARVRAGALVREASRESF